MSYISKFKADTAYSNADINEVLSAITGEGVLPLSPNDILANVSEEGVTISDCRCAVSWANEDKTHINIGGGTVIMADGSYIIIADEILSVPDLEKHYVYIYQDLLLHNIPVCEKTLPQSNENYVLLAEIENGVIHDKRKLAKSKISNYGLNASHQTTLTVNIGPSTIYQGTPFASCEIDNMYSTLLIYSPVHTYFGVFDIESGIFTFTCSRIGKTFHSNRPTLITGTILNDISIECIDGVLYFYSSENILSISNVSYDISLTMF